MNVKGFLFDLGNVLIDFDHRIAAEKISFSSQFGKDDIFNLFFESELTEAFEEGKISPEDFFLAIKNQLSLTVDYSQFVKIWNEIFFVSEKNKKCLDLVVAIKKKFPVVMISNINILHYKHIEDQFKIFSYFDRVILSYEEKSRKPKREIYSVAESFLNADPQEIIYADDRVDLVESARHIGYNAFVFKDADGFKNESFVNQIL